MASSSSSLRIRLLEPSVGVVSGGTKLLIHGKGFRPQPHSLLVRFRLPETGARVEVAGRFLLETQLECVVPSFKDDVRGVIARHANLSPSSATVLLAPHLVTLHVEVIVDSERTSNVLQFVLHQEIVVAKITPQFILMTPATTITATTNILKLSTASRFYPSKDKPPPSSSSSSSSSSAQQELGEISSLPVFARVRQVSERTGAVSHRIVAAQWKISSIGVYEVEFDAAMLTFGDATVDITLNKSEYFRANPKVPEAAGYCVHHDVTLASIDPCCVSVTRGRTTEVRLLGDGFVDSGDLVVRLVQRNLADGADSDLLPVAQLTATYVNAHEIRCSVHPNMSFGLTHFQVSLNGGRQYGKDRVTALLHRDRAVESVTPSLASLEGNTMIKVRLTALTIDDVDAPHQLQHLVPPRRMKVKFHVVGEDGDAADLSKVVGAEVMLPDGERGVVRCRVPSFVDEIRQQHERRAKLASTGSTAIDTSRLVRFNVSLSLGGDGFFGASEFGCFFPPVIQSIAQHHGPCSGGTRLIIRMKHRIPTDLSVSVRFLSLTTAATDAKIVPGVVATAAESKDTSDALAPSSPRRPSPSVDNPACQIVCTSPAWGTDAITLTKVQVSYDGGFNFVPAEEDYERAPRSRPIPSQLVKDWSYLYFLYYPVPRLYSVVPMSADIQGGSFIRITGDHVIDHGGPISVVFQSPQLSRKVVGVIENNEIRCCAPPFNVGRAAVFVSLNGEQYTKCDFVDPDSKRAIEFVYYSSPVLQRLSPLCACISQSSTIRVFGVNLIETGRVKMRFGFSNHQGKLVYKDVAARAVDGVIQAPSPLFGAEYGNLHAVVDVALNGNDFSGRMLSLYYYASYSIKRVDPPVGAFDIPIPVTLLLSQAVVSDAVLVRVRFQSHNTAEEAVFGPVPVSHWEGPRVEFTLPAIARFVATLDSLAHMRVELSFDGSYFHPVGDLLSLYRVYQLPVVRAVAPLVGHADHATAVVAKCTNLHDGDPVTITLTVKAVGLSPPVKVAIVVETNVKRQTLAWQCPSLAQLTSDYPAVRKLMDKTAVGDHDMLVPVKLAMEISTVPGQLQPLPFELQYYRSPTLLAMSPRVGYICGGSLISLEFRQPIETPTIDLRFGPAIVTSGRVRSDDKRLVECLSPELEAGVHALAVSFNEQYFEDVVLELVIDEDDNDDDDEEDEDDEDETMAIREEAGAGVQRTKRVKGSFQVFPMPSFSVPRNRHRVYAFGPVTGGSYVHIRGHGFIKEGKVYVRFCSLHADTFAAGASTSPLGDLITVKARVLDDVTIQCVSPPAAHAGRVALQITYNLQQYTDSGCCFEYHATTAFESRGILCGPVSGGTPVCIQVADAAGLPEERGLVSESCALRFASEASGVYETVVAAFDEDTMTLQCLAPAWPSNELVDIGVALAYDACALASTHSFAATGVRFLFYDPPEGLITIEPCAGPVSGGTEVLAYCGKMVDTGEIMVSVMIVGEEEEQRQLHQLTSVGEDEEEEEEAEDDEEELTGGKKEDDKAREVHLVRGRIVGEAVSFIAPAVTKAGLALLHIALNGINYTSSQTSTLRFRYYREPVIRRIWPAWGHADTTCLLSLSGDDLQSHGCDAVVQFKPQEDHEVAASDCIRVQGTFMELPVSAKAAGKTTTVLQCAFHSARAGCYEIQVSLNGGQQFSTARYMAATYANYSGSACSALLPFRSFASPFFLATPTGSVAGGSTVTVFLSKRLAKLLPKDATKCQVQFAPVKAEATGSIASSSFSATPSSLPSSTPGSKAKAALPSSLSDVVAVAGEIDLSEGRVTCRAPLLRAPGVSTIDLLLPLPADASKAPLPSSASAPLTSCAAFFAVRDREKFYAYESPTITELAPTCGPLSGGTSLVIECSNIVDTGQIFVRFRAATSDRECVLVPATFSRRFPDGSLSASPLLVCVTPRVEIVDRIAAATDPVVPSSSASSSTHRASGPREAASPSPVSAGQTAKARAQSFQLLAELSLKASPVLRVTRTVVASRLLPSSTSSNAPTPVGVLVDFTMNAGEQFIAHSAAFHFYPDLDPRELAWAPRHLPTRSFDRATPAETRVVTVQLPKTLRAFTDSSAAAERVAFFFDGAPQQLFSPSQRRRGSSVVLHETDAARELLVLDGGGATSPANRLRKESTMRRRSTFARNSSVSATSNNLLETSGASLAANASRPRPAIVRGGGGGPGGGARRTSGSVSASTGAGASPGPALAPLSPSSPSSSSTAPYIAARVLKSTVEISCPVPEFSCAGVVRVFFSFNAQQFMCLGELRVHEPLAIKEDARHRFTSNIGGERFVLSASTSSLFAFLRSSDLLNELELQARQRRDTSVVRCSSAVPASPPPLETLVEVPSEDNIGHLLPQWRPRRFFLVQVHVLPSAMRLLKKVVVAARPLGSAAELATASPDDSGCCVVETTDWMDDMLVTATLTGLASHHAYAAVLPRSRFHRHVDRVTDDRLHALVVQVATNPVAIAGYSFCSFSSSSARPLVVVDRSGSTIASSTDDGVLGFDLPASGAAWFICIDAHEHEDARTGPDSVQVVLADSHSVRVHLTAPRYPPGRVWVIGHVTRGAQDSVCISPVDALVDNLGDVAAVAIHCTSSESTVVASPLAGGSPSSSSSSSSPSTISLSLQFACADSSRELAPCCAAVEVVLPGDVTDLTEVPPQALVRLHCAMPSLPFNGPTVLALVVEGVVFSNALCIHCYDPRLWQLTRLDPPAALVLRPVRLRLTGVNFVDNKKTLVRFSDATRFLTVAGAMEKYRFVVVRVAAVRNIRALLPPHYAALFPSATHVGPSDSGSPRKNPAPPPPAGAPPSPLPFMVGVKVQYRDQVFRATSREGAVVAAMASSSTTSPPPLGWESQFEVQVPTAAVATAELVATVELTEVASSAVYEIGRVVLPLAELPEASLVKRTLPVDQHFRWRSGPGTGGRGGGGETDVFLHLSPSMTRTDVVVCDAPPFPLPQQLRVQISSGDSFFSLCPSPEEDTSQSSSPSPPVFRPLLPVYALPAVTNVSPRVLPRSAGGGLTVSGSGFVDSATIIVRLYGFYAPLPSSLSAGEESELLRLLDGSSATLQSAEPATFFIRDVPATFVSGSQLSCVIPPRLAAYDLFLRVSLDDGVCFSPPSLASARVLLFSVDAVSPRGGPVSGHTYVTLQGTHVAACLAALLPSPCSPSVQLKWTRGARELESVVVPAEFYAPEDAVYFYTPPSKFGLHNITLHLELSLDGGASFGRDEIAFVVYKSPTVKAVAPLAALVPGLSPIELLVQGLDEKAAALLRASLKTRFKRRGQMQLADSQLLDATRLTTVVPRFNVPSAVATDVGSIPSAKLWTRHGALVVALLRARRLATSAAKKAATGATCNAFVVLHCAKQHQLKSTRKDGTASPEWNELFDFATPALPATLRLSVENQLSADASELLGQVHLAFDTSAPAAAFATRAWFPLRSAKPKADRDRNTADLGEIEIAVAFVPPPPPAKKPTKFSQSALSLKSTILSKMQQHKKDQATAPPLLPAPSSPRQQTQTPPDTARARRERLLRAFRRQGTPPSLVPSELTVELAVNGQDFWSPAPSRCLLVPPPVLLAAEPAFICLAGGSPLTLSGLNFVPTQCIKVAFAVLPLDAARIAVADAKFRSSHTISCVTPPLSPLGASEASRIAVLVAVNGVDFDSVALPSVQPLPPPPPPAEEEERSDIVTLHPTQLADAAALQLQLRVYRRPVVHRVRAADGVYTTQLVIDGRDFSDTGVALARFEATTPPADVRTTRVRFVASDRLECAMPDFPRGAVVTVSLAVNGLEFTPCPGQLHVYQSPRLVELVPNWVAAGGRRELRLRGINLTTTATATGAVQVSLARGAALRRVVSGQCVDGDVLCAVPHELLEPTGQETDAAVQELPPLMVDVWLGGTHKEFTGAPLALHIYCHTPTLEAVAPLNGPVYGGYSVTIDGDGFLNTGKLTVRFHAVLPSPSADGVAAEEQAEEPRPHTAPLPVTVDAPAKFVSAQRIQCAAPVFPREGVYGVAVALNGVDFDAVAPSSAWFLAWQNWQRRKQLQAQRAALEVEALTSQAPSTPEEPSAVSPIDPLPLVPSSPPSSPSSRVQTPRLVETAFGRRITSPRAAPPPSPPRPASPSASALQLARLVEDEAAPRVDDALVDVRLLQWHPASAEDKHRPLAALLADLFNAPATQHIMLRRVGVALRLKGSRSDHGGPPALRSPHALARAFRLLFPLAPDRHFDELWQALDADARGVVTLQSIVQRLVVAEGEGEPRPRSPEPGPTHYSPSFAAVEPKPRAPLILAASSSSAGDGGGDATRPSELFMDYEAFKAVRPRVQGGAFLKRKYTTSWCNPVPKDAAQEEQEDEGDDETAKGRRSRGAARVEPPLASLKTPRPPLTKPKWTPTLAFPTVLDKGREERDEEEEEDRGEREEKDEGKRGGVSRGERVAAAEKRARPGGRSLLHDDIAPLYLKFLRSKDVQKS